MGLLVIPVKFGNAISEEKLPIHQIRRKDGSRIKMRRFAAADGEEVAFTDIDKGYELTDGRMVALTDADFEQAYGERNRTAQILLFTPLAGIPRTASETSYHVQPAPGGEKAYALLAEALTRTGAGAVVSFALRERESLALLYPAGGYLLLERLHWAARVRQPDFTLLDLTLPEAEIQQAQQLIEAMTAAFDWTAYTDEGAARLAAIVAAKADTGQVTAAPVSTAQSAATSPHDLMAVLAASVAAARAAKAAGSAPVTKIPAAKSARKPRARKAAPPAAAIAKEVA